MTILFAYDGSESADAAIAAAGQLLGDVDATADVVTVWEPLTVEALRAARFGGSPPIPPTSPTWISGLQHRRNGSPSMAHGWQAKPASTLARCGSRTRSESPKRSSRVPTN